ncbi:DUF397 domain-containing protein [Amycolatopsis sp. NPDC059027]|uniref:DUF397 domain-containing protein n=1 Tax=Amycolatopsis sp. NPDC059027 TaxID=3346709 RepID=UPI00366D52EC
MLHSLTWRKSSYTSSNGGNCVEVAYQPGHAHVRDSKAPDTGSRIVPAAAWRTFTSTLRPR